MSPKITELKSMSAREIQKCLMHRYPFLMIDRIESFTKSATSPIGDSVIAYKAVSQGESYFQGHFPGNPVMPGVLILEALSQTAGFVAFQTVPFSVERDQFYLASVDKVKFRQPVLPGYLLKLHVTLKKVKKKTFWMFDAKAFIVQTGAEKGDDVLAAEAQITACYVKGAVTS